jgi:hypothetical protein
MDTAVVDERIRKISFIFNQTDSSVAAVLPHFWDRAGLFVLNGNMILIA